MKIIDMDTKIGFELKAPTYYGEVTSASWRIVAVYTQPLRLVQKLNSFYVLLQLKIHNFLHLCEHHVIKYLLIIVSLQQGRQTSRRVKLFSHSKNPNTPLKCLTALQSYFGHRVQISYYYAFASTRNQSTSPSCPAVFPPQLPHRPQSPASARATSKAALLAQMATAAGANAVLFHAQSCNPQDQAKQHLTTAMETR
jgi:hypothetical protein